MIRSEARKAIATLTGDAFVTIVPSNYHEQGSHGTPATRRAPDVPTF